MFIFANIISFMNRFGGDWTNQKIEIVSLYAKAYLNVMKDRSYFKLIYFDGFAGSGEITAENKDAVEGAALRVMAIDNPKSFDMYYFVELDKKFAKSLESTIRAQFGHKKFHVVADDCNDRLKSLVDNFLSKTENKNYRVLAFIDPKGMQVRWESIEILKGYGIDLWILVPTGMGVNRLLTKSGEIEEDWVRRLEIFLGLTEHEIRNHFYRTKKHLTLFGEEETTEKETNAIDAAANLYRSRLLEVFSFVSEPFIMKNSTNSPMYHFFMATNNKTAIKIANDVIRPKYS